MFCVFFNSVVNDYEKLYNVLNFAMPFNEQNHNEQSICAAPYAITNCYHLVPSFRGRTGFSFLTGSVAMLERSVYNWMFGVNFTLNSLKIKPCLPKEYENSQITLKYLDKNIEIRYVGYGNRVAHATVNGNLIEIKNGEICLNKKDINCDLAIVLILNK